MVEGLQSIAVNYRCPVTIDSRRIEVDEAKKACRSKSPKNAFILEGILRRQAAQVNKRPGARVEQLLPRVGT
jgi:hypothetical protein